MSKKGSGALLKLIIETVLLLVILSLSWYGGEMLLYGYSQPSIIKALALLWITARLMVDMEKERVKNERIEAFTRGFTKAIKEKGEASNGQDKA